MNKLAESKNEKDDLNKNPGGVIILENSPVGESQSNGIVEIAPETLRPLRNLYALWLSENSINCSDVREQLRAQTVCLDQGVCQVPADELVFVGWDFLGQRTCRGGAWVTPECAWGPDAC